MSEPESTAVGRTVLVTGSSRGIGRAIASRLAAAGFDIVVHYNRRRPSATEVAEIIRGYGRQSRLLQFDLRDRNGTAAAITGDIEKHGPYYGVVCNAGLAIDAPFPAIESADWDRVIDTNLNGFYNVLQPVIMPMIRAGNKGRIVSLASISGLVGNRGQVNYSAAKAGIIGATKALALELAKRGITVNCVAPGLIDTDMSEAIDRKEAIRMIPVRRLGRPDEVASLVAYLFSDDAAYITRQVISVNGGII